MMHRSSHRHIMLMEMGSGWVLVKVCRKAFCFNGFDIGRTSIGSVI